MTLSYLYGMELDNDESIGNNKEHLTTENNKIFKEVFVKAEESTTQFNSKLDRQFFDDYQKNISLKNSKVKS